jgi:hypothetical protein
MPPGNPRSFKASVSTTVENGQGLSGSSGQTRTFNVQESLSESGGSAAAVSLANRAAWLIHQTR